MVSYDPSYKTAHLFQYGNPSFLHSIVPATKSVMQDFVLTSNDRYFISQAGTGTDGYEDTIITRYNPTTGNSDSMRLRNAGHGIGFEIEYADGKTWVIMCWRGKTADSGWREYDFVRFPYTPGGPFTYGTVKNEFGMQVLPLNDPEMLVHIDWRYNWVVCKHYDSNGNDVFSRRRWSELKAGIDRIENQITLPINTGTLQGFTTINETLFRYMGKGATNNVMDGGDPIAIDEYDWQTGQKIAYKTYPKLGASSSGTWRDGKAEPEGISVYREADGKASLLVGITTGLSGNHKWETYKFRDIGQA